MKTGIQKVQIVPSWPQHQTEQESRKCLERLGVYIFAPLRRVLGGREMFDRGLETGIERLWLPKRSQPLGKWGLGLITNLITSFEKHGKHGIHGKVVVNERISLC